MNTTDHRDPILNELFKAQGLNEPSESFTPNIMSTVYSVKKSALYNTKQKIAALLGILSFIMIVASLIFMWNYGMLNNFLETAVQFINSILIKVNIELPKFAILIIPFIILRTILGFIIANSIQLRRIRR